jgi:hypothetical protein
MGAHLQRRRGRPYKTTYPDGAKEESFYNVAGQLWKTVDPDGNTTLNRFSERGEPEYTLLALSPTAQGYTAYDAFTNAFESLKSGSNRITRVERLVLSNSVVGADVQRTVTWVWNNEASSTPVAIPDQRQRHPRPAVLADHLGRQPGGDELVGSHPAQRVLGGAEHEPGPRRVPRGEPVAVWPGDQRNPPGQQWDRDRPDTPAMTNTAVRRR